MKRQLIYSILICFACIASAEEIVTWHLMSNEDMVSLQKGSYAIVAENTYKAIKEFVFTNGYGYASLTDNGFIFENGSQTTNAPSGTIDFLIETSIAYEYKIKYNNSYLIPYNTSFLCFNSTSDIWKWTIDGNNLKYNSTNNYLQVSNSGSEISVFSSSKDNQKIRFVKKIINGYVRAKGNANMGTICLPYAVKSADIIGCTCYEVVGKLGADTISGQKLYFQSVDSMIAGMPYIYVVDDTASMVKFTYSGQAVATTQNKNGLYGTFAAITDDNTLTGKYLLTLSNNQVVFACCAPGSHLGANKAYLDLESVLQLNSTPSAVLGRRLLTLGAPNSMGPTTLLDEMRRAVPVEKSEKILVNGQLIIRKGNKNYDVYGREIKEVCYE